jgi:outer membrane receptor protein involved in Fe transport
LAITSGISVSRQVLEQDVDLSLVLGRGAFGDRQESLGLFGEAELGLLPGLTASLGLRYQWDRQRRTGVLASVRGLEGLDYMGSSDFLLPKLTMSYAWSPQVTLGLTALRASNPGGTTISLGGPLAFHPETLWSAEIFARARLDEDRLRVSANLFATRFDDAQRAINRVFRPVFGRPVTFSDIVNVARARSRGLEVGLDWAVHPSLDLRAAGALLSTRLHPAPGQPFGREFQRAPAWSSTFGIAWRPLAPLTLSGQARGRAGYHSDDTNSPSLRVGTGWIFDGRIAWEHSRFRLFAYGRNLSDRFQLTSYLNQDLATAEDPRELGMGLELRF